MGVISLPALFRWIRGALGGCGCGRGSGCGLMGDGWRLWCWRGYRVTSTRYWCAPKLPSLGNYCVLCSKSTAFAIVIDIVVEQSHSNSSQSPLNKQRWHTQESRYV